MPPDERLDSWKGIAAYLKRGVRTVQRWERTARLPVRRLASGGVYAFKAELDRWWFGQTSQVEGRSDESPLLPGTAQSAGRASVASDEAPVQRAFARARGYVSPTIGVDPDSPLAQAHLSLYLFTSVLIGLHPPAEAMPAARRAALHALELGPHTPEALTALGLLAGIYNHQWNQADDYFASALTLEPVPALVRFYYACLHLAPLARHTAALEQLHRGLADDPLFLPGRVQVALELLSLGRVKEGRTELEHVAGIDPQFAAGLGLLGRERAIAGEVREALVLAERAYAAAPQHPQAVGFLAGMLRRVGETRRSLDMLARFEEVSAWALPRAAAESCVVCLDIEGAIEALRGAVAERDPGMWLVASGTAGTLIRRSERWQSVSAAVNLPPAQPS